MRRYERLAYWVNGLSFLMLVVVLVAGVRYQNRFDPYLPILLVLTIAAIVGSSTYLSRKVKMTPEMKREWLVKAVHFYRELGFFTEYGDLTDDKLATKLNSQYRKETGVSLDPTGPIAELQVLEPDEKRLWLCDLERDVMPENHVYADALNRLGEISRGAFQPTDITETWESDKGPIRVEFTFGGVRHTLQPKYREDRLDTDFLFRVRDLFKGTEYQLAIRPGDPIAAAFLTLEERDRIKKERGLFFSMP